MEGLVQDLYSLGLKKLSDVSRKLQQNPNNWFDFDLGYSFQLQAEQIISFLMGGLERTEQARQLYYLTEIDVFHRLKEGEENKIRGVYLKVVRRF